MVAAAVIDVAVTGSSYTCDPPVTTTDRDYLVLVDNLDTAGCDLKDAGWVNCLKDWEERADTDPGTRCDDYSIEIEGGARFQAWRLGELNVIVTDDVALHTRSRAATELCKALNLTEKADRIALFRCVKFGEHFEW